MSPKAPIHQPHAVAPATATRGPGVFARFLERTALRLATQAPPVSPPPRVARWA